MTDTTISQKQWVEQELRTAGFRYFPRLKQLVMARVLADQEAPMMIRSKYETLVVPAWYIICYEPGVEAKAELGDYNSWPVRPDIFARTYKPWDEPMLRVPPSVKDLLKRGCKPCYKYKGVWAKQLQQPTSVKSLESKKPIMIPAGAWLAIGDAGEPYTIDPDTFRQRYAIDQAH